MKKILTPALLLTLCSIVLFADSWLESVPGHSFSVGGYNFTTFTWNDGWKGSTVSKKTVIPLPGYPRKEKDGGYELKAVYHLAKGTMNYCQTVKFTNPDQAEYSLLLTAPGPIKIDGTSMGTIVSNKDWKKKPFRMNGKVYEFPAGQKQITIPGVKELVIPGKKGGTVYLRGNFNVLMVDISKSSYAPDSRQIRIEATPPSGMTDRLEYHLNLTYQGEKSTPLNLKSAMNGLQRRCRRRRKRRMDRSGRLQRSPPDAARSQTDGQRTL